MTQQWLTDLIWVGNALYPRWFVFSAIAMMILITSFISWVILR